MFTFYLELLSIAIYISFYSCVNMELMEIRYVPDFSTEMNG